jgi:hypothetical protein
VLDINLQGKAVAQGWATTRLNASTGGKVSQNPYAMFVKPHDQRCLKNPACAAVAQIARRFN